MVAPGMNVVLTFTDWHAVVVHREDNFITNVLLIIWHFPDTCLIIGIKPAVNAMLDAVYFTICSLYHLFCCFFSLRHFGHLSEVPQKLPVSFVFGRILIEVT